MAHRMHPNSLKNIEGQQWTSETARKAQENSVRSRKANAAAREKLKLNMNEWSKYKAEVLDETDMTSIDVLKILMMKALEDDDFDTAADLAKTLAEFDAPKLARIDQTNKEIAADELSDEELEARIEALTKSDK